jgi:hypothetical protein
MAFRPFEALVVWRLCGGCVAVEDSCKRAAALASRALSPARFSARPPAGAGQHMQHARPLRAGPSPRRHVQKRGPEPRKARVCETPARESYPLRPQGPRQQVLRPASGGAPKKRQAAQRASVSRSASAQELSTARRSQTGVCRCCLAALSSAHAPRSAPQELRCCAARVRLASPATLQCRSS